MILCVVDVVQLVEPWIVDPAVAGSIPVVHPIYKERSPPPDGGGLFNCLVYFPESLT